MTENEKLSLWCPGIRNLDKKMQLDVEACHLASINILKQQLKKLNGHSHARALDVAGGRGRVAKELLIT